MRILLADDHAMIRDGLRPFLEDMAPDTEIIEAGSFDDVLRLLDEHPGTDLALLDLRMPGMEAEPAIRTIRDRHPQLLVVILSSISDSRVIRDMLALGVAGFVPKRLSARAMVSALRLVIAGERYVPASLLEDSAGPAPASGPGRADSAEPVAGEGLTSREREILGLLREGLPNKLIARRLNVSEVTVKSHLCHVFRKLGVQNRVQAARFSSN